MSRIYNSFKEMCNVSIKKNKNIECNNLYFMCGDTRISIDDIKLSEVEQEFLKCIAYAYDYNIVDKICNAVKNDFDEEFQKELYTKLFMYNQIKQKASDSISKIIIRKYVRPLYNKDIDFGDIFNKFASDELKNNNEFIGMVTRLDSGNCIYFIDEEDIEEEIVEYEEENIEDYYDLMPEKSMSIKVK